MKPNKRHHRATFSLAVAILALITLAYQSFIYPQLLEPIGKAYELNNIHWHPKFEPHCHSNTCAIKSADAPQRAVAWINNQNATLFLLKYDIEVSPSQGRANERAVHGRAVHGRVALFPESNGVLRWDVPHQLIQHFKYTRWQGTTTLHFDIPSDRFQLLIELHEPNSNLKLHAFYLVESKETLLQQAIFVTLVMAWIALFFIALRWLIGHNIKAHALLVLVFLAIVIGTQIPNTWFGVVKQVLTLSERHTTAQLVQATNPTHSTQNITLRKVEAVGASRLNMVKKTAHGVLFAALIFLLWHRVKYKGRLFWICVYALLLAIATETAQSLGTTRSANLRDLGIDTLGLTIGLLLIFLKEKLHKSSGNQPP